MQYKDGHTQYLKIGIGGGYGISTLVGYLMPNPFLSKYSFNIKNTSISNNLI